MNLLSAIAGKHLRTDRAGVVEWAEASINFDRCQTYDTPFRVRYSIADMPYVREPMEAQFDPTVREIVFWKCSRAGATENLVFIPMRYVIARAPENQIYIGPSEQKTAELHRERIVKGMRLSAETLAKFNDAATNIEGFIGFQDSTLTSAHNQDKALGKGSGWPRIYADEVSQYRGFKVDMIRERASTYRWAHIVWVSSSDPEQVRPSEEDPIVILFGESDQRYWMMDDGSGKRFRFELGTRESTHGLRWAKDAKRDDGSWNLQRVADTAHYVTPSGVVITNDQRLRVVKTGEWQSTLNDKARPGVRGYHLNRFHVPFADGDFGAIAVKWLSAVRQGQMAIRTFRYEIEAEKFSGEIQIVADDVISAVQGQYKRGEELATVDGYKTIYIGKKTYNIVSADVQMATRSDNLYYVVRQFVAGGDSGLIDRGHCSAWNDLKELAVRHKAVKVACDNSYEERQREVYEQCARGVMRGMVPCFGRDNIRETFKVAERDVFEGTPDQGRFQKIPVVTWNPNAAKDLLFRLLCNTEGHRWYVYKEIDALYRRHMMSERNINGAWIAQHKDTHWRDCEAQALMMAIVLGIFTFIPAMPLIIPAVVAPEEKPESEKPKPKTAAPVPFIDARDFHL